MLDELQKIVNTVNSKIESDEKVRSVAGAKDRTIQLVFTDDKSYVIEIKGGKALPPREGTIDDPTIRVKTDKKTMDKLIQKKLNPLMAYAMKKIKVDGPMDDIMILKDFF
ncbi:MAG: SCP2 sterol-binding domain-containing protein [Candidatus Thermoplasmatota archaeon]|nr:SCP2 sterol-binding domain-containing protein [Candidatus Thermoplasmatota archaeon]